MMVVMTACRGGSTLEKLTEARRLAAELLVEFTKAADAANRSVMATTDEDSAAFARESELSAQTVQRTSEQLRMIVTDAGYSAEAQLVAEFDKRFAEYQALDREILGLAVENTNLKAQRLSFGPIQKEADAFRASLESIARAAPRSDEWQVKALVATAVSAVREMQVLQAPHIAEAADEEMTRLEKEMATSAGEARSALDMLRRVQPSAKSQIDESMSALNRFTELNGQLIVLSRRNSNVRSLALSLGKKRMLTAACEESLRALQGALAKRGFVGTR
jgi:hypothetical protein